MWRERERKNIRLCGCDYSLPRFYFVTICVKGRECLFGKTITRRGGVSPPVPDCGTKPSNETPNINFKNVVDYGINASEIILNDFGKIACDFWQETQKHFVNMFVDTLIVMPNHVHAIIEIADVIDNGRRVPEWYRLSREWEGGETPPLRVNEPLPKIRIQPTLGQIIAYYKYKTTKKINTARDMVCEQIWQRNFYDRIIRNDRSLNKIRQYIRDNPRNWDHDLENGEYIKYDTEHEKALRKHYAELACA